MALKIRENYSPNFDPIIRKRKTIRFLIFHYTGMKSEIKAIKRLTEIQSEVGAHYFIKKSGEILDLVPFCDNITKLHPFCLPCCKNRKIKSAPRNSASR